MPVFLRVALPSHEHKEKKLTKADMQHHGQPGARDGAGIVIIAFQGFPSHWPGQPWWGEDTRLVSV